MAHYIDKNAFVAEIDSKIEKYTKRGEESDAKRDGYGMYWGGVLSCLNEVRTLCDTLEVKEVDLEKEHKEWLHQHFDGSRDHNASGDYLQRSSQLDMAKHFFELGLKEQIMTSKLQQRISVLKMEFWTGLQTFEETEMTLSDAYNQGVDDILEELGLKAQK